MPIPPVGKPEEYREMEKAAGHLVASSYESPKRKRINPENQPQQVDS